MRLFGIVALLILILSLAEHARDPESWNWFFGIGQKARPAQRIDNRVARKEGPAESGPSSAIMIRQDEPPERLQPAQEAKRDARGDEDDPVADMVQMTWSKSWRAIWRDIRHDDRTLLFRVLESTKDAAPLGKQHEVQSEEAIDAVDRLWNSYQSDAFQEIGNLTGNEQSRWVDTLRQVNGRWKELKRSLQLASKGGRLTARETKLIADYEQELRGVCFALVRDDGAFLRPDEKQIWFHLLHDLRHRDADSLAAISVGNVGYAAMYNQPETYRGKVVTLRAQVRWAYRVPAIDNHLGIKEFNVLWLLPEGNRDTPVVVYALALPPGFPELKDRGRDRGMTKLYEDVVVSGYFFKRGAYRGQDGIYTAPLVLANVPVWKPSPGIGETDERGAELFGEALLIAVIIFVLAAGVVYVVASRSARPRRNLDDGQVRAQIADLRKLELPPTVGEALKRLAQEEQGDAK